jgi:formamidopyrimidine-DNA glycosylase
LPELPEVQSFVNSLNVEYAHAVVEQIRFQRDDIRFPLDKKTLRQIFSKGVRLQAFERLGKQLIIVTEKGAVHVSLGMSGSFVSADPKNPKLHEHVTLVFSDGRALGYLDPRRFGFWLVAGQKGTAKDVTDATDKEGLKSLFLKPSIQKSSRSIKDFLMDQSLIGGVGNIYALEVLFRSKVHPERKVSSIRAQEWQSLAHELPLLMQEAIARGGSSISTYRNLHGDSGGFQDLHRVYAREGEPCLLKGCVGQVMRIEQGGRSSWFCSKCQSLGAASINRR